MAMVGRKKVPPEDPNLPDVREQWDTVWLCFDALEAGKRLNAYQWWRFSDALRACEAAQKDRSIALYIHLALRQRQKRASVKTIKLDSAAKGGTQ